MHFLNWVIQLCFVSRATFNLKAVSSSDEKRIEVRFLSGKTFFWLGFLIPKQADLLKHVYPPNFIVMWLNTREHMQQKSHYVRILYMYVFMRVQTPEKNRGLS